MATTTREPAATATAPTFDAGRLYRLSLDQYERLAEAGIIGEDEPVELLYGLLVTKMTKGDPHVTTMLLTLDAVRAVLPAGWHAAPESPVALPDGPADCPSMPEPDVSVRRGGVREYAARKPLPADVALVVEVAMSSLAADREKLLCYAWARIPVAWIVNLVARTVEVYTQPTGPDAEARYRASRTFGAEEEVPVVLDGREVGRVAVRDLLP